MPLANTRKVLEAPLDPTLNIEDVTPVEDENTERPPCEEIPPAPTIREVPAIIFPWTKISFLDWKLPTSADPAKRLETSVPEISITEIVSSRFVVYAYRPDT